MPLPTARTPPKNDLASLTTLLYGQPKIGKSTFCSKFDNALFLACEAGLNSLDVHQLPITNWLELLTACREIKEGSHAFRTIIVDTVDNAYKFCMDYICGAKKIDHPSDLDWGKGNALVNNEFTRVITALSQLPYGLVLVSHAQTKEIKTTTSAVMKTIPTLPDSIRKTLLGMADIILYADVEPSTGTDGKPVARRVLKSKPSPLYEAGDRTGRLPDVFDLDYPQFVSHFNSAAAAKDKVAKKAA